MGHDAFDRLSFITVYDWNIKMNRLTCQEQGGAAGAVFEGSFDKKGDCSPAARCDNDRVQPMQGERRRCDRRTQSIL
jgi:hypothetical protein